MTPADAFSLLLIVIFIVAYRLRDRTKDREREQAFWDSITGSGPWSKK
jgi:hypothetical protein